jgi:hypothetical protein
VAFLYKTKLYQILSDGLYCNGSIVWRSESRTVVASVCAKGDRVVLVSAQNSILVLRDPFKKAHEFTIDLEDALITAADISADFVAIACFDEGHSTGNIFLLSKTLDGFGEEFVIPSPVISLKFALQGKEILAASRNGTLLRWSVSKSYGFVFDMTYVFFAADPIDIVVLDREEFAFLANGKLFFIVGGRVIPTALADVSSICCRGTAVAYVKGGDVFVLNREVLNPSHRLIEPVTDENIQKIVEIEDVVVAQTDNSIQVLDSFQCTARFDIENIRLWAVAIARSGGFSVAVVSGEDELTLLRLDSVEFSIVATGELHEAVFAMDIYQPFVVVGFADTIKLVKASDGGIEFRKAVVTAPCPIAQIAVRNELIWIARADSVLAVYKYDSVADRFELCCVRSFRAPITIIRPFDDLSAVVAFDGGLMAFVAIPHAAVLGLLRNFVGSVPSLNFIAGFPAAATVTDLIISENSFIYSTADGGIGALVPITSRRDAMMLIFLHMRARQFYQEKIGLYRETLRTLSSIEDVIDWDILEPCATMDHAEPLPPVLAQIWTDAMSRLSF